MSDPAIYSTTLRDTLEINEKLRAKIRRELLKHQNRFTTTREELVDVELQLATMEFLAVKAMETLDGLLETLRLEVRYGGGRSGVHDSDSHRTDRQHLQ